MDEVLGFRVLRGGLGGLFSWFFPEDCVRHREDHAHSVTNGNTTMPMVGSLAEQSMCGNELLLDGKTRLCSRFLDQIFYQKDSDKYRDPDLNMRLGSRVWLPSPNHCRTTTPAPASPLQPNLQPTREPHITIVMIISVIVIANAANFEFNPSVIIVMIITNISTVTSIVITIDCSKPRRFWEPV